MGAGGQNGERRIAGPRLIAIVGPFQSGKTSLLESLLVRAGGAARQGSVRDGTSVGDSSPEARSHAMSVEPNVASVDYMGDRFTFVDCPGSVEFIHDMRYVLPVCDAAVVVCEADARKTPALQVILRELEELGVPRIVFLNKVDLAGGSVREALEMLQPASRAPLLLRQLPTFDNGVATGFVDLALERAFVYREAGPSEVVEMPAGIASDEKQARYNMLEKLADYDDALMEQLISDIEPPRDRVFDDLAKELRDGHIVPLMIGSATAGHGVTRLLKALRHEAPGVTRSRGRLGVEATGPALAQVLRTVHTAHGGKLSLARVLRGSFPDGAAVVSSRGGEERIAGVARLTGAVTAKLAKAEEGDTVAFARLESFLTGDRFSDGKKPPEAAVLPPPPPHTQAFAIVAKDRKDEVRLAAALAKLCRGGPLARLCPGPGIGRAQVVRPRRDAPQSDRRATRRPLRRGRRDKETFNRLSRDDPRSGDGARPAQEAVGRSRPVRRRGGRGGAARPRRRIRLRREGPRRHGAETIFLVGRDGRARRDEPRAARLSGGRRRRDADRRLLPHGRFVRHGVPRRDQDRARRGSAQSAAGAARADPRGDDLRAVRRFGARQRAGQRAARPDPRFRVARGLARVGRPCGRRFPKPRSAI